MNFHPRSHCGARNEFRELNLYPAGLKGRVERCSNNTLAHFLASFIIKPHSDMLMQRCTLLQEGHPQRPQDPGSQTMSVCPSPQPAIFHTSRLPFVCKSSLRVKSQLIRPRRHNHFPLTAPCNQFPNIFILILSNFPTF